MRIVFCGVGEAFDEHLPNISIWIQDKDKADAGGILLDCGFTGAAAFWSMHPDPLELDAVWISHLHGDHFFGLPQLCIRFHEHGRSKPLQIYGGPGIARAVAEAVELAYPGKWSSLGFYVDCREVEPGENFHIYGYQAQTVPVQHPVACLGLFLSLGSKTVFYTGDGRVDPKHIEEIRDCDLAICEAFCLERDMYGHSSVLQVLDLARTAGVKQVALVHMQRDERRRYQDMLPDYLEKSGVQGFLPQPGDVLDL